MDSLSPLPSTVDFGALGMRSTTRTPMVQPTADGAENRSLNVRRKHSRSKSSFMSPSFLGSDFLAGFDKDHNIGQKVHPVTAPTRRRRSRTLSGTFDLTLSGRFATASPQARHKSAHTRRHARTHSRSASRDYGDRFIPARSNMNPQLQLHKVTSDNQPSTSLLDNQTPSVVPGRSTPLTEDGTTTSEDSEVFSARLAKSLFGNSPEGKMLSFATKSPFVEEDNEATDHQRSLRTVYSSNKNKRQPTTSRYICSTPERILDAPDLVDDYYLNLLDWSDNNLLAVGLGPCLYLWNAASGDIQMLFQSTEPENIVTSVKWNDGGTTLAVGVDDNTVQLWDAASATLMRTMKGHSMRVSALAWNQSTLSSGGRDSLILNHDVRAQSHLSSTLQGHDEEVCGLAWSTDGTQLASGANDNICQIWDRNVDTPRVTLLEHTAAVKALAWCPFQRNLLATGGGTADRHIRFYNTGNGKCQQAVDTKSQVCSLVWSKTEKELVSSHGFSLNQLTVWNYPTMKPLAQLTGHKSRVLHTALSPDGTTVCSAAADETLRFWNIWDSKQRKMGKTRSSRSTLSRHIR